MLSKKILSLLVAASALTPTAAAIIENVNVECAEAATNFVSPRNYSTADTAVAPLYGFRPEPEPDPTYYYGDVNADGKTDIADYTTLKKYIETDGAIKIHEKNADVTEDGKVDFLDLLLLKDYI